MECMIAFFLTPDAERRLDDDVDGRREEVVFLGVLRGRVIRYFLCRKLGLRVRAAKGGLPLGGRHPTSEGTLVARPCTTNRLRTAFTRAGWRAIPMSTVA